MSALINVHILQDKQFEEKTFGKAHVENANSFFDQWSIKHTLPNAVQIAQ